MSEKYEKMSRISNSLLMLFYLNNKNTYTKISELSDYLEVSEREIRRYRDDLEMAGFYIESKMGRDGGYRLMNDVVLTMNINHIKHILLHYNNNYEFLTKISKEGMLDVVKNLKDENLISSNLLPKAQIENLVLINLAVKTNHQIEIVYKVKEAAINQTVDPYMIKIIRDRHYLFALHNDILKTYRMTNIKRIDILSSNFVFNHDIYQKEIVETAYGIYRTKDKEIIRFKVFGKMNDFAQDTFDGKLKVVEKGDKSTIYQMEAYNLHECVYPLLSLGSSVKILFPKALIDIYKKEIKKIERYF